MGFFFKMIQWGGVLWMAAILGWAAPAAFAQQAGQPANGNPVVPESPDNLTPEQVLWYLSNEKVVAAGVGFLSGEIGDPLSSILSIWGEPVKKRQDGLLGNIEFFYQPDPNLAIVFSGKETVKTISIKGSSAAIFRTWRGARFGMPAQVIARLYSFEDFDVKNNRAEFEKLGIDFHFAANLLNKVVIYAPKD